MVCFKRPDAAAAERGQPKTDTRQRQQRSAAQQSSAIGLLFASEQRAARVGMVRYSNREGR